VIHHGVRESKGGVHVGRGFGRVREASRRRAAGSAYVRTMEYGNNEVLEETAGTFDEGKTTQNPRQGYSYLDASPSALLCNSATASEYASNPSCYPLNHASLRSCAAETRSEGSGRRTMRMILLTSATSLSSMSAGLFSMNFTSSG
jgi:hypothetical protein